MISPFVGFISLTPPVGTPLLQRGALQTGICAGNIYFLISFFLEKRVSCCGFVTFLQNQKVSIEIPDLLLATCDFPLHA